MQINDLDVWENCKFNHSLIGSSFFLFCFRAEEVKEHPFFKDVDWKQVYLLKLTPPLIPPRGEVNAADAFDIGNFDEDDTKGIKVNEILFFRVKIIIDFYFDQLTESDQELYKNFPIVISERWQQEITGKIQ